MSIPTVDRMAHALRTIAPLIGLCLALECSAQSSAQFVLWGDHAMRTADFYGASRFYAEALGQDGGRMELQWKYAEACRLSNQYPQAAENYAKVWRKDLGRSHPEALRWLGEMQLCSGDYDEAEKTWNKLKQKTRDKSGITIQRAENALEGIRMARRMMAEPEKVLIEHLPEPVNTYDSEFGARTGPDSALYVSSLRGKIDDNEEVIDTTSYGAAIYRSARNGEGFAAGERYLSEEINAHANTAWSADGQRFFFTRCPGDQPCVIAVRTAAGIVPLEGIGADVGSTQPMVAQVDGHEVLFFASDRDGGEGGMDIWRADLHGTSVSDPRPLGRPVNTPGNETCPFYDVDQRKLYFSSDFLPGFGGYDNFMSRDSAGTFTPPVNFGYPLNGPANDLYPTFELRSMSGYFTSNRIGSFAKKGATCCNDIYRYSYPDQPFAATVVPVKDTLTVAERRLTSLREKLPIRLYFHNDEPDPRSWDTLTTLTYEETYRSYKKLVPAYHSAWGDDPEGRDAIDGFFRDRVDLGFERLNQFITLLEQALDEGQRIELQVRGFASPLAKSDYNANLSLRRISSMMNYLRSVDNGRLRPYLASGALRIRKSPFGEDRSDSGVSDQLEDLKGSVYSVGASMERRIEIEQVMLAAQDTTPGSDPITNVYNVLKGTITQDIGTLPSLTERDAVFLVRNSSTTPMRLLRARPDCDCVSIELPDAPIAGGGTQRVTVHFNGRAPAGHLERGITVETDGEPATLRLIVTGTITPFQ